MIEPYLRLFTGTLIRFSGFILITVGVGGPLLWFLFYLAMYGDATPKLLPILTQVAITLGGVMLSIVGASLLRAGKRAQALPADELLLLDKRAPVLYLRSFSFDDVSAENTITSRELSNPMVPAILPQMSLSTYEDTLAGILRRIGPCIAVGFPATTLQVLGFSRLELPADEWQIAVTKLMKEAALVLICSGSTTGVQWELKQAAELVAPEKLVILITSGTTEDWWQMADGLFQTKFPRIEFAATKVFGGVITFDQHGTPRADELFFYQNEQASIENSLKDALKPIFIRLRVYDG